MVRVRVFLSTVVLCALIVCMGGLASAATESPRAGTVMGVDTFFAVTDSAYRNITVTSSETVNLAVDSSTDSIVLNFQPITGTSSATITLAGLEANTVFYKYDDDESNESTFTTDANGQYTFVQDVSSAHDVLIDLEQRVLSEIPISGSVSGEGTHFEVTDSDFLNVTLDSSESIRARLTSVPEVISLEIEPSSSASTTSLIFGGLVAGATYYLYIDDFSSGVEFVADALGQYGITQDITDGHVIYVQTTHSTTFLSDNATGGDCTSIGVWDAATKTCTLTGDVQGTIQINSNGITLDGNGFTIIGNDNGTGIYASGRSYVTIKNVNLHTFVYGIYFYGGGNNTIRDNNLWYINWGILVKGYSSSSRTYNNTITNNTIYLTRRYAKLAIQLYWAMATTVSYNTIQGINDFSFGHWGTWDAGIYAQYSCGEITENTIKDFYYGMNFPRPYMCPGTMTAFTVHHNSINTEIGVTTSGNWGWSYLKYNTIIGRTYGYYSGYKDDFFVSYNNFLGTITTPVYNYASGFDYGSVGYNYYEIYDTPEEGCYDTNYNGYCDAPFTFPAHYYLNKDNYPRTSPVPDAGPPLNDPPVADAGPDQVVECVDYNATPVTLDGSGSSDPDGDTLTYSWTPFDPPATGVSPQVLMAYGTGTVTLTVDDGNGGSSSDAVDITVVDTTAPVTTATSPVGTEGNNGWYVSDVSIDLAASDNCSGVQEIHYTVNGVEATGAAILVSDEGVNTVTYWAEDNAGNIENANPPITILIDKTAPAISYTLTPSPNAESWNNSDVTVTFICTDETSGIDSCPAPVTVSTESAAQVVSGTARDVAGNEASASVTVKLDKTVPAISYTLSQEPNAAGWNNSDVTVTFTCTDELSGIDSCPAPVTVSTEGSGQVVSGTARDVAGNEASASVTIKLDKTAPVITITGVTEGQNYLVSSPPTPGYTVTDALSGMASDSAALTGGNENGVGTYTYTVTATDVAGNIITQSVTYKVIYSFDGFQMPLGFDRPYRLGSTIPVKFILTDGNGNYVTNATATLSLVQLSGSEPVGDPIDGTTNVPDSGNVFRYDSTDNQYIYNLDSGATMSVGSWSILITLDDGETYSFDIGVK